ncbi:MAG: DUF2461 domain-containing protein [Saprospirales bacterium]|nr:DUF2461 domain-containing protein [Saprospirales bacterium]MBK8490044.1 DUF2461 domain-containing protein [Saprospirales bacterium]
MNTIPASTLEFLRELQVNNNREWFTANKPRYQEAHTQFKAFSDGVLDLMSHHDNIEAVSVYRIYRDVRFSKDKLPYKNQFSASMSRATKWLRGGYYFHIEPGASFVGGGFWQPESADLKRVREEIAADDKPLRKILADPVFVSTFGELQGDRLKTAPQGFPKDHPAIDLLQYKNYLLTRSFNDKEVLAPNFQQEIATTFLRMRPFLNYMSEVLTTDGNGLPL